MESNPISRNPIHIDTDKAQAVLNDPDVQRRQPWRNVGRALYRCLVDDHDMLANMLFDACIYEIDVNECDGFTSYRSLFNQIHDLGGEFVDKVTDLKHGPGVTIVAPHEMLATNKLLVDLKNCTCPGYSNYFKYDDIVLFATLSPDTINQSCYELCGLINRFSSLFALQRLICQFYADNGYGYAYCEVDGGDDPYSESYTLVDYHCDSPLWNLEEAMLRYVRLLQRCLADEHKHDLDDEYQRLNADLRIRIDAMLKEDTANSYVNCL